MVMHCSSFSIVAVFVTITLLQGCSDDNESQEQERTVFRMSGTDLVDPCGEKIILKGVNKMSVFDEVDISGEEYFPEIAKTGSNCVRIVWRVTNQDGTPTSLTRFETLIKNCIANKMIPMVELHDATCDWGLLDEMVDYWVRPDVVELIQRYEHALLVNIANEAGDGNVTAQQFTDGYKSAITRMRDAGIRTPLIIDAQTCGQELDILVPTSAALIAHDPDHNIMFSVHPYWSKIAILQAQPTFIKDQLKKAKDNNIPLILGELCGYGGWPGNGEPKQEICNEKGSIDYQTLLAEAAANNFGYLVWEWGPGNAVYEVNPPYPCPGMDITTDGTYESVEDIVPGSIPRAWIRDVIIDSPHSIKNTAQKTSYILNGFTCQ